MTMSQVFLLISCLMESYDTSDCWDALGLEDGTIRDCQISASSSLPSSPAESIRFNGPSHWETAPRGSPFLQHEYLQVSWNITNVCILIF